VTIVTGPLHPPWIGPGGHISAFPPTAPGSRISAEVQRELTLILIEDQHGKAPLAAGDVEHTGAPVGTVRSFQRKQR
jgi:hypothetical protein